MREDKHEELKKIMQGQEGPAKPTRRSPWKWGLVVVVAMAGWWWDRQTEPIRSPERAALTAKVREASRQSGESTQAIWQRVKKTLGVRKIEDITRWQVDEAKEIINRR